VVEGREDCWIVEKHQYDDGPRRLLCLRPDRQQRELSGRRPLAHGSDSAGRLPGSPRSLDLQAVPGALVDRRWALAWACSDCPKSATRPPARAARGVGQAISAVWRRSGCRGGVEVLAAQPVSWSVTRVRELQHTLNALVVVAERGGANGARSLATTWRRAGRRRFR
jgi:hypothetical protein